jgi:uncharacterized repeat protein (TIGR01451 family)
MTPAGVSPERRGNTDGHWLVAPMARPSQVLRRPAAAVFAAAVILMLALAPGSFFGLPEPDFPAASINPDLMKTADRTVPGEVRELASAPRITSDLADYAPGATAVIVIDAVDEGATVAFEVDHVADPGADGVWGTLDDVTVQLGGAGHDPWFVTDGSDGDLDGVADGKLSTSWHVNPDDSLDQRFLLTGQVVDAGSNGAFGTDGDVRARRIASNTFTDSGGDYTIDFSAGNPLEYQKVRPADLTSFPAGRQSEPIPGALDSTATEALSPVGMALGQIVPFIFNISMGAKKGAAATGDIQITAAWSTTLTNGGAFGYDPDFGVVAAFIDGLDPATSDGDSRVTGFTWRLLDAAGVETTSTALAVEIEATVTVANMSPKTSSILEVWVVLQDDIAAGLNGNVQSMLVSAAEISDTDDDGENDPGFIPDPVNTGNQTVPLNRVQEFFTVDADVSIVKSDEPGDTDPVAGDDPEGVIYIGGTLTYTLLVRNNDFDTVVNGVVVTDPLDANVTFVNATVDGVTVGAYDSGTHAWTYSQGFLERADSAAGDFDNNEFTVLVTVAVNGNTAPSTILSNSASVSTVTDDPNLANNTDTETTVLTENFAPVAVDDVNATLQNTALVVAAEAGVLANDSDPESHALGLTQFTVDGVVHAAGATASLAEGELTINADGSYSFVPAPDYNGDVPVATYTVTDSVGAGTTATLTLTVTPEIDANLTIAKSVEVYDPDGKGLFAIPGRDVIYTIEITNLGDAADPSAIEIVDPIPPNLILYRGAFDGSTTEPVKFVNGAPSSGLTCCTSAHISYSTDGTTFSYLAPNGTYDPSITHLKVNPAGVMGASGTSFNIQFRARIR